MRFVLNARIVEALFITQKTWESAYFDLRHDSKSDDALFIGNIFHQLAGTNPLNQALIHHV